MAFLLGDCINHSKRTESECDCCKVQSKTSFTWPHMTLEVFVFIKAFQVLEQSAWWQMDPPHPQTIIPKAENQDWFFELDCHLDHKVGFSTKGLQNVILEVALCAMATATKTGVQYSSLLGHNKPQSLPYLGCVHSILLDSTVKSNEYMPQHWWRLTQVDPLALETSSLIQITCQTVAMASNHDSWWENTENTIKIQCLVEIVLKMSGTLNSDLDNIVPTYRQTLI